MNKKLILIALFGLYIPFSGLAMESTTQESVKPHISNFNPEHDTQPIIDIFNENSHWLSRSCYPNAQAVKLKVYHEDPKCNIKVLKENKKIAGYIIYTTYPDKVHTQLRIDQVAVSANFRKKGYGKLLVATAIKELDNIDTNSAYAELHCYQDNIPALNMYAKMGFEKDGNSGNQVRLIYTPPHTHTSAPERLSTDDFL